MPAEQVTSHRAARRAQAAALSPNPDNLHPATPNPASANPANPKSAGPAYQPASGTNAGPTAVHGQSGADAGQSTAVHGQAGSDAGASTAVHGQPRSDAGASTAVHGQSGADAGASTAPGQAGGADAGPGAVPPVSDVGADTGVAPYGGGRGERAVGNGAKRPRRYRVHHLRDFKSRGEKWAMLTAYDQYTAEIFDQAGIPVLLVGDSAANNVYGYDTTLRVTVDELIPLARAVANAVDRALVVADLPFGSYQASPEQAFHTAVRFMKEAGVHAVKLEGGRTVVPMVEKLTQSGIPVMAHIGFTPQSEHSIGGYRVQGRGEQAAGLIDDAVALADAGAFSLVLEMVPGDVAAEITKRIPIPTIGIGAGRDTDAQVLVWQDMAGLRSGTMPRFVKQYADLRGVLTNAATTYAAEVASGAFPGEEHTF
ncbi:3-methyl-2-oxobutanoate hydroxymethyltransferase [Kribbella sp. HUAS MG21]|uniref:3-methyl-2-oxobutanoate hydroxymethyltransferase n=1 Tax=Kribbella sp. HUAS MG21 TaxID=3160966 RepID=A0AAU7TCM5_9ACTN